MNPDQAKVIVLRSMAGWLFAVPMSELVTDWRFQKAAGKKALTLARLRVLADLKTVISLNEGLAEQGRTGDIALLHQAIEAMKIEFEETTDGP